MPTDITVTAEIAATPEVIWAALTTPAQITQWNFATDDWCCPAAHVALEVGGRYHARMEAKDGSAAFDFDGVFEVVEAPKTYHLRLADGRLVRTTVEAAGQGARVTTVFDAEDMNPIELQRDGWQAILNSFKRHVEAAKS